MTPATTTTNYLKKIQKWGRGEQEVQKITTLQKNKIILQISNSDNFLNNNNNNQNQNARESIL
jgi:hypothetical protein